MSDFVSFTVKEIEKIGLVCPTCKSEIVITVPAEEAKIFAPGKTATAPHKCPACLAEQILPFARNPDWLEWMATLKRNEDAGAVRLYFKEKD